MKIIKLSLKETGQTIIMGLIFSTMLLGFISYNLFIGEGSYNKIRLQNIVDSAAYSGAVAEAKILNSVAALNEGIVLITNIVTVIVIVWLALKACAALCLIGIGCACLSILKNFERIAKPLLKRLKNLAWAMAALQDEIIKYGKLFVLSEIKRIVNINGANLIIIYPFNPFGNLKNESTLGFYLKRAGDKSDLKDSPMSEDGKKFSFGGKDSLMKCYTKKWDVPEYNEAYEYYYINSFTHNIDWVYKNNKENEISFNEPKGKTYDDNYSFEYAKVTECKKVSDILTGGYKLPNPLIFRNDFQERQKVIVLASLKPFKDSKYLVKTEFEGLRLYEYAQAKPYGTSMFEMKWEARLEKGTLVKNALESASKLGPSFISKKISSLSDLAMH